MADLRKPEVGLDAAATAREAAQSKSGTEMISPFNPDTLKPRRGARKRFLRLRNQSSGSKKQFVVGRREARTLNELIRRGEAGATSGDFSPLGWARRTSAYVHKLRQSGLDIETRYEAVGDAHVGRYVLLSAMLVVHKEVLP